MIKNKGEIHGWNIPSIYMNVLIIIKYKINQIQCKTMCNWKFEINFMIFSITWILN
jgi:hypothetical protein